MMDLPITPVWVDTDYGFDDLWALLLLRRHAARAGLRLDGLSLVAGNAPLPQVIANAQGAALAYGLDLPLHAGAARPLLRAPETAQRILGPRGMTSRGRYLPDADRPAPPDDAVQAMADWLQGPGVGGTLLALGPLTNIALLMQRHPCAAAGIGRLIWMGGSDGPGNHSPAAEFNALADPEAAAEVAEAAARLGLSFEVADLMVCRQMRFGPADLPPDEAFIDPLTADLLWGYLDIGLARGRPGMSIYDPVAALALLRPDLFTSETRRMQVSTCSDESYGATLFTPDSSNRTRLLTGPAPGATAQDIARLCLGALCKEDSNGFAPRIG